MNKWRRDEKIAVGVVALIGAAALSLLSAIVYNVATGHEVRIVKHMRGNLWDYDSYEVVR